MVSWWWVALQIAVIDHQYMDHVKASYCDVSSMPVMQVLRLCAFKLVCGCKLCPEQVACMNHP